MIDTEQSPLVQKGPEVRQSMRILRRFQEIKERPTFMKILLTILVILYALSPYDILPDMAVGWGWLDDLILLYLVWRFFYSAKRSISTNGRFSRGAHRYFRQGFQGGTDSRHTSGPGTDATDPYTTLGISRHATTEEIKQAYRKLANQYHPDKVHHLGDEFKELAEERFKEIEEAYRILTKQ